MDKQEEIKLFILSNYTFFDNGYSNVVKPDNTNIYLDANKQVYVGINDTNGNFFYIRDTKDVTYEAIKRGARIQYYNAKHRCRIVAFTTDAKEDVILKSLINSISSSGSILVNSDTDSTRVFKIETGAELIRNEYIIVSCDFIYSDILNIKDCSLNPCNC